jgi:hypothetical protein
VLYISFGTICYLPDKQLFEIASAIEASGYDFIWVVPEKRRKKNGCPRDLKRGIRG